MRQEPLIQQLHSLEYDQTAPAPLEQVVFRIQFKTVGSLGDMIMFSGRPKAGKSKYIAGAIAASISRNEVFSMNIRLPEGKSKVAHFDTEQSKYSHYKMMQLVTQLSDLQKLPDNFKSYRLRSVAPEQIKRLINYYLQVNPDCGIVYLDGLLDMVTSMNDEKNSNSLKQWMKQITEDHNVLLAAVIHRGFSNDKSIGQIGSEGERAAQTVLLIEKNKETHQYIMRTEYMRDDDEIDPIAIQFNPQLSLWQQCDYIEAAAPAPKRSVSMKRRPAEYDISEHTSNSYRIFNSTDTLSYKKLIERIVEVYGTGQAWAKECIVILEQNNIIWRVSDGFTNVRQGRLLKVE